MGKEKPSPEAVAKASFVITMVGAVLYIGMVFFFVL